MSGASTSVVQRAPRSGGLRRALLLLGALVALLLLSPGATALEPQRLPQPVTDLTTAQVLGSDAAAAEAAVAELAEQGKYRLWTVYVDSFDGMSGESWARETFETSGMGPTNVLLAVATQERGYGFWFGDDVPESVDEPLDAVVYSALTAAVNGQGSWADATIAAAKELQGGSGSSGWIAVGVLGAGAVGVGAWAVARRRRGPAAAPGAVPTAELVSRSGTALVEIDDELRSFEQELGFAEAQFGSDATGAFAQVLADAKAQVGQAFAWRKQLDGATTEPQQRELATRILQTCEQVSGALGEQSEAFEALRREQADVPQRLVQLGGGADALAARVEPARALLASLAVQYPATALASVSNNPDLVLRLVDGARTAVTTGQQHLATGDAAGAVSQARVAETALGQGAALLDAVDRAGEDLAQAGVRLQQAAASITSDVADAQRLAPQDAGVGALVLAAQHAVAAVPAATGPGGDPLAALAGLADAETALDAALAPYREAADVAARARAQITERATRLEGAIRAANDYIDARRGAVGPAARTDLAEAIRLLGVAQQLAGTDPAQALTALQQAEGHVGRANQTAQRDVASWEQSQNRGGGGGIDMGSLILGSLIGGRSSGSSRTWGSGGSSWSSGGSSWSSGGGGRSSGGRSSGGRSSGGRSGGSRSSGGRGRSGRF